MIEITTLEVNGIIPALHGMRNPKNSWHLGDSYYKLEDGEELSLISVVGDNDRDLATRLANGGPVHAKYRRMITVYADITAPMYWWAEFDTYKVGTVRNSCSKMHKLLAKPFEMKDFSFDKLPWYKNEADQFAPDVNEEEETWRSCPIGDGYEVSDCGRMRHRGRILSGSLRNDGYVFVYIGGKQYPIHRIVAKCFIENPDGKPEVNHKDGNKRNNRADNLEWVTRSENVLHSIRNNLQPKGNTTYKGKFTPEEREAIKALCRSGRSKRSVASEYGVSHTCICDIVNDKYKYAEKVNVYEDVARPLIDVLNELRDSYLSCTDEKTKKSIWYSILQLLPESYNQRSTVMLNYETLANICEYRAGHKLDEWRTFIDWAKELPCSWMFLKGEKHDV